MADVHTPAQRSYNMSRIRNGKFKNMNDKLLEVVAGRFSPYSTLAIFRRM